MVDSAVYSEFFGYIDPSILSTPVSILSLSQNDFRKSKKHFGKFRSIYEGYIKTGEQLITKCTHPSLKYSDEKNLTVLAVEARIATLIGNHQNIVEYFGLTVWGTKSFIVQSLEPSLTAKDLFMRKFPIKKEVLGSVLQGITSGMTHMHEKGFLHNNLIPENIALRTNCEFFTPVILSLSLSCREACSKPFTIEQQTLFDGFLHLPPCVRQGLEPPSYSSDRYSIGFFIGNIVTLLKLLEAQRNSQLEYIQQRCFRQDKAVTAKYFFNKVTECCVQIGYIS